MVNTGITTTAVEMAMVFPIPFLSPGLVRLYGIKAAGVRETTYCSWESCVHKENRRYLKAAVGGLIFTKSREFTSDSKFMSLGFSVVT
jgi:hypothetical protein